ncbi:hypothetical protein [Zooshikella harenae]|uniref:Uncharacterized protein n=1 Tax=Zooshikella harenae TaxID=2827238 RepID=A0ABS5ZI07_9GAMM|nr:hypothetical protein [Zooshikella harenae]MBU2713709.1 hypothetical protein [Zooshikella harenae]
MIINKVVEELWQAALQDQLEMSGIILRKLKLETYLQSDKFCELFIQKCVANQNVELVYDFWSCFDKVAFSEGFNITSSIFKHIHHYTDQIKSDYFAFRVMDWIGSFRSREVADYFELIYDQYKTSPLYENLGTGLNNYLYVDYCWEADPEDKARMKKLYEKIKASYKK